METDNGRAPGMIIGYAIMLALAYLIWRSGHPYSALFMLGAAFQHVSEYVCTMLGVGVFEFKRLPRAALRQAQSTDVGG